MKPNTPIRIFALAVALSAIVFGATAFAAQPEPGATYAGKVHQHLDYGPGPPQAAGKRKVHLKVNQAGTDIHGTAKELLNCGTVVETVSYYGPVTNQGTFQIHFSAPDPNPGLTHHVDVSGSFVKHGNAVRFHMTDRMTPSSSGCAKIILNGTVPRK